MGFRLIFLLNLVFPSISGSVVRFDFGVVDHDCEDNVVLHDTYVIYNGVKRGRLHTEGRTRVVSHHAQHPQVTTVTVQAYPSAPPMPSPSAPPLVYPAPSPPTSVPPYVQTTSPRPPSPQTLFPFPIDARIHIKSVVSGRNVRINETGLVDACGGNGQFATFIVSPNNGYLRLRNFKYQDRFLAIRDGVLTYGTGGKDCELFARQVGPEQYVFRAVNSPAGVGFLQDGRPTLPAQTLEDVYAHFIVSYAS